MICTQPVSPIDWPPYLGKRFWYTHRLRFWRCPLNGSSRLPDMSTLRRMLAAHCPLALYYILRLLTCIPPVAVSFTRNAPDSNLHFGPGLILYAVALGFIVATTYTILLRSFMTGGHDAIRKRRSLLIVTVVGGIDMAAGLVAINLSGGWGSPFWHCWLSSLIIPCLILGMRRSLLVAVGYIVVLTAVLSVTGEGTNGIWMGSQRYFYVGAMFTLFLLSAVVGYLGDVCFELQRRKMDAENALRNLGTMLEVTRNVAVITTNVNEMMRRVARTIGEQHRYDSVGIYLSGKHGQEVRLAGWVGDLEDLQRYTRDSDHLIHRAISDLELRSATDDSTWSAAMPIRDGGSLLGVLLIVSNEPARARSGVVGLDALVGQIAVGIRVADLRQATDSAMTYREWETLTGQIHDRVTGSLYALLLHLGACATAAEREDNPMAERLAWLLPHSRHLLFYTRQYLYRLLPVLRGEGGLDTVVTELAREFQSISGMDVPVSVSGSRARLPLSAIVACYDIIQQRMGDVLQSATASEFRLELDMTDDNIRLSISDNGLVDEVSDAWSAEGLERIRQLARDAGGELSISEPRGVGTRVLMGLANQDGNTRLDNPDDHRRELFSKNGNPGDA